MSDQAVKIHLVIIAIIITCGFSFLMYKTTMAIKEAQKSQFTPVPVGTVTTTVTVISEAKKCHDRGGDYMAYQDQNQDELVQRCKTTGYIDLSK